MCLQQQLFNTTNVYEICMLAYTLFFSHTRFLSVHSPMDLKPIHRHPDTFRHPNTSTLHPVECTHKDPPMHTHIYHNEGFGLWNSFSENKTNCQKEKKPGAQGTAQVQAHTYTHTVEPADQDSHQNYSYCSSAPAGYASLNANVWWTSEISGSYVHGHISN